MLTKFWEKVVYFSNYLLYLIPTEVVWDMTPLKKWSGRKASIKHLKTFGCIAWAHIPDDKRRKLDANSHVCIMMGYFKESKTCRLFDLVIICRVDVVFHEKTSDITLLNCSSRTLSSDPLEILKVSRSTDYYTCLSTRVDL
jgi:hypothetical protein